MTVQYTTAHVDILLAQCLRSATVLDQAAELTPHFLRHPKIGASPYQAITFGLIKSYYDQYKTPPDRAGLIAEVRGWMDTYLAGEAKAERRREFVEYLSAFFAQAEAVGEQSEPMVRAFVKHVIETCVIIPERVDLIAAANTTGVTAGLAEKLTELEAKQASLGGGNSKNNILSGALTDKGQRVRTDIPWIDSRLGKGRGPVLGCVMGIIAPQGAGKTTMGIQLAVSQALSGKDSLLVLVEEGASRSVKTKIAACALGVDYTVIDENATEDDLKPGITAALAQEGVDGVLAAKKYAMVEKHLHVLDCVASQAGLQDIIGEILAKKASHPGLTYVYVDWAGILADSELSRDTTLRTKEEALKRISYRLSRCAQQTNTMICIAQQMNPQIASRGPMAKSDRFSAADCRGFSEPMKYVWVLNPIQKSDNVQLVRLDKARDDVCTEFIVRLQGAYARFDDVSEQFAPKGKKIRPKDRVENRIPEEVT